jgi:hypothetical protein
VIRRNERTMRPTSADAAQTALDKVLYAQSLHGADHHNGDLAIGEECRLCVALGAALEACRIAAIEDTVVPEHTAHRRTTARRKK